MFYHYRQNNSGGSFTFCQNRGISVHVIVEAGSAKMADERAEEIGLYFDGCENGRDCSCCGDRWSRVYEKGNKVPSIYNSPVKAGDKFVKEKYFSKSMKEGQPEGFIHYEDGRVEEFHKETKNGTGNNG